MHTLLRRSLLSRKTELYLLSSAASVPHLLLLSSIWRLKSVMTSAGLSAPKRAVPATMTFEPACEASARRR